jgi:ParB family transcriptional regulator, chromosome partitioning protein
MRDAEVAATARRPSLRPEAELRTVPVDEIVVEENFRQYRMDDENGRGLRDSIKEIGVLQPVLLAPLDRKRATGERYLLVAGFRRFSAACEAGLTKIPARICALSREEVLLARLTENVQRLGATPLEEAQAISDYCGMTHCTQAEVAHRLGKSLAWVTFRVQVLNLPSDVRELVAARKLTVSQLAQILTLPSSDIEGIRELAREATAGMPAAGLKDIAKGRLYWLAGGTGSPPASATCGRGCSCRCACCLSRRT